MVKSTPPVETPEPVVSSNSELANAIAAGISAGMAANAPRRKVTISEYDPKTQYHPNKKTASHLTRKCFQNGIELQVQTLFDREIDLLNQIDRSGRYIKRLVEVNLRETGPNDFEVHLHWNNKRDAAFQLKNEARSLVEILEHIIVEQAAERAEEDEMRALRAERKGRRAVE